jgi:hypothetical protein
MIGEEMTNTDTFLHWVGWIIVHLYRLTLAIVIVGITAIIMTASIAISLGKGSR